MAGTCGRIRPFRWFASTNGKSNGSKRRRGEAHSGSQGVRSRDDGARRQVRGLRLSVDIGGTFTDVVAIDDDGDLHVRKALSTPQDQSVGVMDGLTGLA